VILTAVPSILDTEQLAEIVAKKLDSNYLNPDIPDLTTVDKGHLDSESAERWAIEFWRQADTIVTPCITRADAYAQ
jgi:hypothetical protein